jgi:hypothetical protein
MPRNPETDIGFAPSETMRALGASVRGLMECICAIDGPKEELEWAIQEIDAITERLGSHFPDQDVRSFKAHIKHEAPENARLYRAGNPRDWDYNPVNPPMEIQLDDDGTLHGHTWLGLQYEGPPNIVHGGIVAHLLDQMLGYANTANKIPGFTGTLTIRYVKPTPLFSDIHITAKPTGNEGRKIFAAGQLFANGELTAEAEGVFLRPQIPPHFAKSMVKPDPSTSE